MRRAWVALAALIAWAAPALSQDDLTDATRDLWYFHPFPGAEVPPRPSGKGWRRIAAFPDATDSRCIGHPHTPVCAVETYIAGAIMGDGQAFYKRAMAGKARDEFKTWTEMAPGRYFLMDTRIDYDGPVRCDVLFKFIRYSYCPRFEHMVVVSERLCYVTDLKQGWYCDGEPFQWIYFMKRARYLWRVVYTMHVRRD